MKKKYIIRKEPKLYAQVASQEYIEWRNQSNRELKMRKNILTWSKAIQVINAVIIIVFILSCLL